MTLLLLFAVAGALGLLSILYMVGLAVEVASVDVSWVVREGSHWVDEAMRDIKPWLAW